VLEECEIPSYAEVFYSRLEQNREQAMPRNDQVSRQWFLLRKLEDPRGATLQELVNSIPDDFPKNPRTIRRDLEALEAAGFPLTTDPLNGQTR
jgi:hypothetical protein